MKAFYGQDLHWKRQYRGLFNLLDCDLNRESLLKAFRSGEYRGENDAVQLSSTGELPESLLANYQQINDRYMRKLNFFKRAKKMSGALGKNLPAPIKSRLRKIFTS